MLGDYLQAWIDEQSNNLYFGELTITLKYHDGKLAIIEKSKAEKTKLLDEQSVVVFPKKHNNKQRAG